jgi:hypothetical protein
VAQVEVEVVARVQDLPPLAVDMEGQSWAACAKLILTVATTNAVKGTSANHADQGFRSEAPRVQRAGNADRDSLVSEGTAPPYNPPVPDCPAGEIQKEAHA